MTGWRLACVLCLTGGMVLPASADEFILKDGAIVNGEVVTYGATALEFRIAREFDLFDEVQIQRSEIQERIAAPFAAREIKAFLAGERPKADRLSLARLAWRQRSDGWIWSVLAAKADDPKIGPTIRDEFGAYQTHPPALWPPWITVSRNPRARLFRNPIRAQDKHVRAALDWLAAHQDDDGRIDADGFMKHDPDDDKTDGAGGGHHGERRPCAFDGAVTGVALLAWFAYGSTARSGPYAKSIARAIPFCRRVVEEGPRGFDQIWNYAFCTQALAEAYWMERDPTLRPVLVRAVRDLVAAQLDGGWRYIPRATPGVPTSAAVGTALGMCARVGIPVPAEATARLVAYFEARVDAKSGRSEYHDSAERMGYTPTRANTAAALATLGFFPGLPKRPKLRTQLKALTKHKPKWKIEFKEVKTKDGRTVRAQVGYLYPYAWYYTDLAIHFHGKRFDGWRATLRRSLQGAQRKDGAAKGSWDPLGTYSDSGGRGFVTALGALMLLSPVRYAR